MADMFAPLLAACGIYAVRTGHRQCRTRAHGTAKCRRQAGLLGRAASRGLPLSIALYGDAGGRRGPGGGMRVRQGNLISGKAEIDFYRTLPPSGYTKGPPADCRTDVGAGDLPPE